MSSLIHPSQTVSPGVYSMAVQNACSVPHDFIAANAARIDRAYRAGEPVWMIADEIRMVFETRPIHRPMKTPRMLAQRVVVA